MQEQICFINGSFVPAGEASVSVFDRGLLFGDGVYEVLRIRNAVVFRPQAHYLRMQSGLDTLGIGNPWNEQEFACLCAELAQRNRVRGGHVYLQVTRGVAPRTHLVPRNLQPTLIGFAAEADLPKWKDRPSGLTAITVSDPRWARCNIKTTMLLPNSLAKQRAADAGAYEAVFVSEDGLVREGASTNVFVVLDDVIYTHPDDQRILPGITRAIVLDLAQAEGLTVKQQPVQVERLQDAHEVFLTGTTTDVGPVIRIDDRPVGNGKIGPVTAALMHKYSELLADETGTD